MWQPVACNPGLPKSWLLESRQHVYHNCKGNWLQMAVEDKILHGTPHCSMCSALKQVTTWTGSLFIPCMPEPIPNGVQGVGDQPTCLPPSAGNNLICWMSLPWSGGDHRPVSSNPAFCKHSNKVYKPSQLLLCMDKGILDPVVGLQISVEAN